MRQLRIGLTNERGAYINCALDASWPIVGLDAGFPCTRQDPHHFPAGGMEKSRRGRNNFLQVYGLCWDLSVSKMNCMSPRALGLPGNTGPGEEKSSAISIKYWMQHTRGTRVLTPNPTSTKSLLLLAVFE